MKAQIEQKKEEIEDMGLSALKNYLLIDVKDVKDRETLFHFMSKAKLGMQITREWNLQKRSVEGNTIRIFKLTSESKAELKKLFKKSLPHYFA